MIRKAFLTLIFLCTLALGLEAQSVREFKAEFDSLRVLLQERTTVYGSVKATKILKSENSLNFYFNQTLGDYPWRNEDIRWFRTALKELLPEKYKDLEIGRIYIGKRNLLEKYPMPAIKNDGGSGTAMFRTKDPRQEHPFIERTGERKFDKGLSGRNIALWQSHGRYYEEKLQRWEWQRATLFQTVEDLYTQSYVLPFLIPMLENAGAYVMTPRERDIQTNEVIADNDKSFTKGRGKGVRIKGEYIESGLWEDAGTGFADTSATYLFKENPFLAGTARKAECAPIENFGKAEARWIADIPQRGEYSVYISYKSLPNSTDCAHYTVRHLGGTTEFAVDQRKGGGTWIYLGTFEFDKGTKGCVILDNEAPDGRVIPSNAVITADAVRFGGGMGKVARGQKDAPPQDCTTSGMPSYTEGALYWMQWAGVDSTILNLQDNDYTSDYADRGAWVGWMSGGSKMNPDVEGKGIHVDLSFGFHTDAGTTPNDSIVGTLGIYTLLADGKDKLPNGEERLQCRLFTDYVQTQIVDDIRRCYNPQWSRRGTWDRSYSESRTPPAPAMLLELLSHQNFEDMKYGLNPSFRFAVSRSVYKGMLKFLSSRYGCEYVVQPLPVNSFATSFRTEPKGDDYAEIRLSWKATQDTLEKTASPTGYILYTRIGDGAFDQGKVLENVRSEGGFNYVDLSIPSGHIYSYRIVAFNDGGRSFPSETLSIGVPNRVKGKNVTVVNNFTRVSEPAWFDTPDYAGFNNSLDSGVPYIREINFIGEQYEMRRTLPWTDDDNPGFGGSYTDQAGKVVPGNTFDFTIVHGRSIMAAGCPFNSVSSLAFTSDSTLADKAFAIDIICGKQVTSAVGGGKMPGKYQVFPVEMQKAISSYTSKGGNVLISGSHIGTDAWDCIYPIRPDSLYTLQTKEFIEKTLGYRLLTGHPTRGGAVSPMRNGKLHLSGKLTNAEFHQKPNPTVYNVETPDGIVPSTDKSETILRYSDTNISAATCLDAKAYKTVCVGFPLEVLKDKKDLDRLIEEIIRYFER